MHHEDWSPKNNTKYNSLGRPGSRLCAIYIITTQKNEIIQYSSYELFASSRHTNAAAVHWEHQERSKSSKNIPSFPAYSLL